MICSRLSFRVAMKIGVPSLSDEMESPLLRRVHESSPPPFWRRLPILPPPMIVQVDEDDESPSVTPRDSAHDPRDAIFFAAFDAIDNSVLLLPEKVVAADVVEVQAVDDVKVPRARRAVKNFILS